DENGALATFTIPPYDFNDIVAKGGIDPEETGDVYWNIIAINGVKETQPSAAHRRITVGRYAGIQDIPVSLFIYGEAAEGGTDYSAMPQFKYLGDGVFEAFTQLTGGREFQFINRRSSESHRSFWVGDDGVLFEEDAMSTVQNTGVYRIVVDFLGGRTTVEEVTNMRWHHSWDNTDEAMTYQGYGRWTSAEFTLSNTSDTRNFFYASIGGVEYKLGHRDENTGDIPDYLTGTYWNVFLYDRPNYVNASEWNWWHCYKLDEELLGNLVTMHLDLSSDEDNYNFLIDIRSTAADPVTVLNTPTDGYEVNIKSLGTTYPLTFDWDAVDGPSSLPERYEILFFTDEECTNQIFRQEETGMNDEIPFIPGNGGLEDFMDIPISDLLALTADMEEDESGNITIYWTVRSRILGYRTMSPEVHKLVLQIPVVPKTVSISGNSSEYDNNTALKQVGAAVEGKFEIYGRFSGTNYTFTDQQGNVYRLSGNSSSGYTIVTGTGNSSSLNGIYRITLDFIGETATVDEINDVRLYQCSQNVAYSLTYEGKGVWTLDNQNMGSGDNRYLFRVFTNGATSYNERWGSQNLNNDRGPGEDGFQESGFWDIYVSSVLAGQWDYSFKFYNSRMNGLNISAKVYMTPNSEAYYHEIIYNSYD
ncbi:MAG: hypothetical protein LIO77_02880, partial [Rikenellaceae bacterium]|nr:hypothetical protein [Rikenellaceae bacterium]